ncbi:MAG TPA: GlsB/YeaQ/YmgE family stress response membrane protein [Thermoguttaceae bacterium]|nr:GlsB/YeaQ/YmgE family stress response membrane protein [Thermoguttaceae bacterium]
MLEFELSESAQHWVNVVLIWVGFGTLAGLLALVILPVRRPSSPIAAMLLGIVGSMVGLLILSFLVGGQDFNPISPLGFLTAVAGAFVLLILYRVLCMCVVKSDRDPG